MSHNVIDSSPYNGLSMGWGWWNFDGSSGSVKPNSPTTTMKNNTVTYNRFFNTMQELTDSGPIYTLGSQPGTVINNNDIEGVPGGKGKHALHQDEGSAYMTIENDVMNTALDIENSIEVGTWGRQHDFTYKNNYRTEGTYADTHVPNSSLEPIKTYSTAIWPADAYSTCVSSGIESAYQDIIPAAVLPIQDVVFPASLTTSAGSSVTIKSAASSAQSVWFAPGETTTFTAGSTMTQAPGTSTTMVAPAKAGTYKLYVVSAGSVSKASVASLVVGN